MGGMIISRYKSILQSGTALGATWDVALIEEVGLNILILAQEAKLRAVSSMNGPTCNIQRVSLFFILSGFTVTITCSTRTHWEGE
jgi:hypothetical protein